jgi:hypothetical protein
MAVLLDITYSKKLGLPNYSSHSLGIGLKAEVANLDEVRGEVEKAYSLLQQSVDSQIVHSGFVSNEDKGENGTDQVQKTQVKVNGGSTDPDSWSCTIRQRGLILSILERNDLDPEVVEGLADDLCGKPMNDLNKGQISAVITKILDRWGRRPDANGRTTGGRS